MLEAAAPVLARPVAKTFNHSLETGTFPSDLKNRKVTALPKSADRPHPSNYQPISILPALSTFSE